MWCLAIGFSQILLASGAALGASSGPATLPQFELPVRAVAIDAADGNATYTCAWWAKKCWSSFSPPPNTAHEGAPSLACGLEEDGHVTCWTMVDRSLFGDPVMLTALPSIEGAVDVAVGRSQVCVLDDNGQLSCMHYAWNASAREWVFGAATKQVGRFRDVDAGGDRICAVSDDGSIGCWTSNGDCDNEDEDTRPRPVKLRCSAYTPPATVPGVTSAVIVATSWLGGCAIDTAGKVVCWGENALGNATNPRGAITVSQLGRAAGIAVSNTHACAVRGHGDAVCWAAERGVWASGLSGRDLKRLPAEAPVNDLQVKDGVTCWADDAGVAWCQERTGSPVRLSDDVIDLAVGEQVCARRRDNRVVCWAKVLPTSPRAGDAVVTMTTTLFTGGGAANLGGRAAKAFELGARVELNFGAADRAGELTFGGGPLLELRSRDLRTRELSGGLGVEYGPWKAGNPSFYLGALAGYAARPGGGEPTVTVLTRTALRQAVETNLQARGRAHYAMQIALYASGRYGLRSREAEILGGIELDLWLPVALARELK